MAADGGGFNVGVGSSFSGLLGTSPGTICPGAAPVIAPGESEPLAGQGVPSGKIVSGGKAIPGGVTSSLVVVEV